jgi:Ribbon-helix-helix protein, copG family
MSTGTPLDTRGDGRAPMIGVRLSRADHARLWALAESRGLTVSEFVRRAAAEAAERAEREAAGDE